MPWPQALDRAVWVRHGVVEVERLHTSAGEQFVIVRPFAWTGDAAWIPAKGITEHLRPLVARSVAERWLRELQEPGSPAPPGDLRQRRARSFRTVESGTSEQQVVALAHVYRERHRPDADDVTLLDALERLVVLEIACVLERDAPALRAQLRAGRTRFAPDAPPSGEIVEPADTPAVPDATSFVASFEVGSALHVTDADGFAVTLPAVSGRWDAVQPVDDDDDRSMIVFAREVRDRIPLDRADARVAATSPGYFNIAVMDDGAQNDPLVLGEFIDCEAVDLRGRGVAWFQREAMTIHVWERGDRCFALELTLNRSDDR